MIFMSSCATMFSGSRQQVSFASSPPGALVRDQRTGEVLCITPCRADVMRGQTRTFSFEKEGYRTATQPLFGSVNPTIYWNLLYIIPSFLLLSPLVAIDFATGAAWQYTNPNVTVRLQPND